MTIWNALASESINSSNYVRALPRRSTGKVFRWTCRRFAMLSYVAGRVADLNNSTGIVVMVWSESCSTEFAGTSMRVICTTAQPRVVSFGSGDKTSSAVRLSATVILCLGRFLTQSSCHRVHSELTQRTGVGGDAVEMILAGDGGYPRQQGYTGRETYG